jgi:hypothetical protein
MLFATMIAFIKGLGVLIREINDSCEMFVVRRRPSIFVLTNSWQPA